MITKLQLKNWKSHLDSELRFSPGVNALVGIVGSGKTSIMDAVSFGLFGTVPGVQSRRIKLNDLIMRKPQQKKEAEVRLEFMMGNDVYAVRRVIRLGKGTAEAEIRKNGKLLDVSAKAVNREVEKVLQMDYELFSKAVYSEQNELDYFLRIPKGKRMAHIDKMLKVDRFEKVRECAVSLRNRLEQQVGERARLVEEMEKERLEDDMRKISEDMEKLNKEREMLKAKKKGIIEKKEKAEKLLQELEKQKEELEEIRSNLKGTKELIKEASEQLEKRKKIDVRDIDKMISEFSSKLKKCSEELENLTRELGALNASIKAAEEALEELKAVEGRCPVCESRITPEKREELIKLKETREAELRERVRSLVRAIENLRKEKERIEGRLVELRLEKQRQEESQLIEKRLEAHLVRERELSEILKKREGMFSKEELHTRRKLFNRMIEEEAKISERILSISMLLEEKNKALEGLKKRQELLRVYREETKRDEAVIKDLGVFVRVLETTQESLRGEFVKTVNSIMDEVWSELYPYGDFRGIRLVIDGDYVLQLNSSEGWINVEGAVSGGERSIACLALRIAFSRVPNLRWLILDEPTHNLDARAIKQLAAVLQERIGAFAEQVFLITHEERMSEGVDTLYKLERDKEKDGPTMVMAG